MVKTLELPIEEWSVCLPDHHPGYVTWEEYLAKRGALQANVRPRGEGGGAARDGEPCCRALLRCGRCGRRMQIAYSGNDGQRPARTCARSFRSCTPPARSASSAGATRLDRAVADAFLEAVTPAGVARHRRRDRLSYRPARRTPWRATTRARTRRRSTPPTPAASSTHASPRTASSPGAWKRTLEDALGGVDARSGACSLPWSAPGPSR